MSARSFIEELRISVAAMQAAHPEKADALSRAHAAIVEGHVVDLGGGNGKVLSRNGNTWYTTNGSCECKAASYGNRCRHLEAWRLFQHVQKRLDAQQEPQPAPAPAPVKGIDPRYVISVHGQPMVRYVGLLKRALEDGLIELRADFLLNEDKLATLILDSRVVALEDGVH
jgi:hypothetical protein